MKSYHELPNQVQAYLHSIELHASILALRKMMSPEEVNILIRNQLNKRNTAEAWQDVINAFFTIHDRQPLDKKALIFYYLTAGCGISKITKLLNVGQATVYKVRDNEDYSRKKTSLEGMFLTDSTTIDGLKRMTNVLQILDGFRVVPKGTHSPLGSGNYQDNYKNLIKPKEKVYTLGVEFPE